MPLCPLPATFPAAAAQRRTAGKVWPGWVELGKRREEMIGRRQAEEVVVLSDGMW